jgi:hypothetical protein
VTPFDLVRGAGLWACLTRDKDLHMEGKSVLMFERTAF